MGNKTLDQASKSRMMRVTEVAERLSLSVACIQAQIDLGIAPPWVYLGPRARRLPESSFDALIASRIRLRQKMKRLRDLVEFPQWTEALEVGFRLTGVRLLTLRQVEDRVGLKSTRIYELIDSGKTVMDGRFPAPIPVTKGARRWLEHEIEQWLKSHIAVSMKISGARKVRPGSPHDRDRADRI